MTIGVLILVTVTRERDDDVGSGPTASDEIA